MPDRLVRLADLGAWLLKGAADRRDLATRFARDPHVDMWGVHPSYRTALMAAGQPALFWGSGSRQRIPYGIWGLGTVTGEPFYSPDAGRWVVPLDLTINDQTAWVRRDELRGDPRLAQIEVLRQPQAANPSYLTRAEFEAFQNYL